MSARSGLLNFEERKQHPIACPLADGFLVAWPTYYPKRNVEFVLYRKPWDKPQPLALSAMPSLSSLCADRSGSRIAMSAGDCYRVFHVEGSQWNCIWEHPKSFGDVSERKADRPWRKRGACCH
jgi:hypothetical protein